MLISLDWIKDFTEVPNINIHDIANDFTMKTAEVEEVKKLNEHLKVIVVAEIVSLKKHPEADRLNLVTFNYGEKEFKEVVCGAPNLEVGQKVPYAKLGTTLPNGITLEPKKIRGYLSEGMLCSATELGLGEDSKGLLQLGKAAVVGQTMLEHLELNQDYLIDVDNKSLTHRPDLWGMYGIAREFAAIYHKPLKNPFDDKWKEKLEKNFTKDKSPISPKVESDSSCLSFWGLSVDGVQVGPSPKWIQDRLIAVGLRPINNIVDISNYVMMELGLPLHIYDRELIGDNTIHIKRLGQNDVFETLDEIKRDLISTDTVICDSQKPLVLAGIMGGANSGVRDETTKIFIEVANWKPEEVRRTSVRLGLRTDSSARYEKSLDSKMTYRTLLRTLELVKELCPEAYVVGKAEYDGLDLSKIPALQIQTSVQYINRILGTELERKEIVSILESLDFKVENSKNDELQIIVPSYRATKDIEGAHDIVEEIGRIIGYETIPVASPKLEVKPITLTAYKNVERKVQDYFSLHANSYEIMTYPLVGEKLLEKAHWSDLNNELVLVNALSQEADRMRPSLLPSLIEAASVNTKNFESFRFFEWGRTYHPTGDEKFFHEKNMVGVCFYSKEKSTFLELLNSVENFLNYVGINFKFQNFCSSKFKNDYIAEDWNGLHPYEKQEIIIRGKVKGALTTIHPLVCRDFKIKGNLSIALIDLTEFTSAEIKKSQSYTPLPKFPAASFDCTVLVEKNKPVASVFDIQKKLKIKDLESMKVVQVFSLNEEHNAVTIRFVYQDPSKTLEPAIIKGYEDKCVATLADFGYSLKV
ncbi:MAG: phenylalanine--tRNA ligase subunit beta [Halobacteriovoraceae bacterium]|nr:phenylalanine--tRNA ligase subunit beta [Halobacteriovoraceae bacterium]MCB9093886.1 phenylalanine--tRNA ligase subunit beta [Halobacteriovoraceae bacterium]